MGVLEIVLLFLAGAAGGALNSVAGGGSFIVFPTLLLLTGMGPVAANATTAVALWPAGVASVGAYRSYIPRDRKLVVVLSVMAAVGGGLGAALLLVTSDSTFARILPALMLVAAVIFTFGPAITKRRQQKQGRTIAKSDEAGLATTADARALLIGGAIQLVISMYGGYFGGGMGIMMLATFTLMGMTHLHQMNALKVILGILINGVALVTFIAAGKVVYGSAAPVAVGAITGGWLGASLARRVDPQHVRKLVLLVAWSLTCWFFWRAFLSR